MGTCLNVNFNDLNGEMECDTRRLHSSLPVMKDKKEPIERAIAERRILIDALQGKIKTQDIRSELEKQIPAGLYRNDRQRTLKLDDCAQEIGRCVTSVIDAQKRGEIDAILYDLPDFDIQVGNVIIHHVRPNMLVFSKGIVRAVIIRTGKPVDKSGKRLKSGDGDKKLLALAAYAKEAYSKMPGYCPGSLLTGEYWFLRKPDDVRARYIAPAPANATKEEQDAVARAIADEEERANFDPDFFTTIRKNGQPDQSDNIISVCVEDVPQAASAKDRLLPLMQKYETGMSPEECTDEQCKECPYNALCHYEHPPVALEEEEKVKSLEFINLSPVQDKIVHFNKGYAVVNAAPGSGKTLALCLNVVNDLLEGAKPSEILVISFTRSAANVFKQRIQQYNNDCGTGEGLENMIATTFNGFGQLVLEDTYRNFGFSKAPRVIEPCERFGIIEGILNENPPISDLDYRNFAADMRSCKGPLSVASQAFGLIKSKGYSLFDAVQLSEDIGRAFCSPEAARELIGLYDKYEQRLKEQGLIEYADQEMLLLELIQNDPYYFDRFGFKHIMVDEAQDCSLHQFEILKALGNGPAFQSMMVVGDDYQSIYYSLRSTSPEYFLNFDKVMGLDAGAVQHIYMTDNYRSTPEIVGFSNKIMEGHGAPKPITANRNNGKKVTVRGFGSSKDEYEWIADSIAEQVKNGRAVEDIAFLAFTRSELAKMASCLAERNIPSVMLNPERLQGNSRIQAALAYARSIQNPLATEDIITALNGKFHGTLFSLSDDEIKQMIANRQLQAEQMKTMDEETYKKTFFEDLEAIDEDDEIYEEFLETLKNQPTMQQVFKYCDDFTLYGDREEKRREKRYPGVVLTTGHSSKGLEWPVVYNSISKYDENGLKRDLEDEKRRLFFVSATRAKEELYVTGLFIAYGSGKNKRANRFLLDAYHAAGVDITEGQMILRDADYRKEKRRAAMAKKMAEALEKKGENTEKAS